MSEENVEATHQASHGLNSVIEELEATRWAAHLTDDEWTLVWVSSELQALLGTQDPEELGVGRHLLDALLRDAWRDSITEESELPQFQRLLPMMVADTPGGRDALKAMVPDFAKAWLDGIDPTPVPPIWTSVIEFLQEGLPPARARVLDVRLGSESERVGGLRLYGSDLPAHVLALVGRGDESMFERMARIFEPRQRQAAILFADLEASGALSRRFSSETFFDLIREMTTRVDERVISKKGVVGKHAGDGVTAFFVAEDLGSPSAAARTAIEAGLSLSALAEEIEEGRRDALGEAGLQLNIGLHWGDRLYMGQVVTGGRIEVTALGDEVNECARIEQTAKEGQILASKNLIERMDDEDAGALDMRPGQITYRTISDLGYPSEKAVRDAGGIAVVDLRPVRT